MQLKFFADVVVANALSGATYEPSLGNGAANISCFARAAPLVVPGAGGGAEFFVVSLYVH